MSTILVTGGAGFIGSHLCEALIGQGHAVISLDNYFTGTKANHIKGPDYREGHTKDISKLVSETPDIVYHLGEYSRTAVAIEEPDVVLDLNITGTAAVLEFCRTKKCKLIYAGSSTKFSTTRPDGTTGPGLSPYTWSKAVNTDLISKYADWYGIEYATVYFNNVYGPRELSGKYGTAIAIFKEKYLQGKPLPVNKPGTQKRRYTHVADTISALLLVGEKGSGDGYSIASDDDYSTRDMAELFETDIEMKPERKTSRPSADVDTSKIKNLGWEQKHNLKSHIKEFLSDNSR
ncbi:MAG: NAD-dependent epimerase/dehydratase family protein [Patescibacteria group bacterium]